MLKIQNIFRKQIFKIIELILLIINSLGQFYRKRYSPNNLSLLLIVYEIKIAKCFEVAS